MADDRNYSGILSANFLKKSITFYKSNKKT